MKTNTHKLCPLGARQVPDSLQILSAQPSLPHCSLDATLFPFPLWILRARELERLSHDPQAVHGRPGIWTLNVACEQSRCSFYYSPMPPLHKCEKPHLHSPTRAYAFRLGSFISFLMKKSFWGPFQSTDFAIRQKEKEIWSFQLHEESGEKGKTPLGTLYSSW